METLLQDLRFSIRTLRKSPGFALTAILTLALGIGAVTSVFSVVDSVLLKPFAFPEPDRLVVLRETVREMGSDAFPDNYKHYLNWKANSKTLADAAIFENNTFSVSAGTDHPEIVGGLDISPNFFSVLGVAPALGRSFRPEEATKGHEHEVILSWSAWQKYFNGDPGAIGRTLRVGGEPQTVVGVLPRGFSLPHMSEMMTSISQREVHAYEIFQPLEVGAGRQSDMGDFDFLVIGRLKPGVSLAQAESELGGLQQAFVQGIHFPMHLGIAIYLLKQDIASGVDKALWLLLAAVATVLLIVCVNLTNLQLARAVAREREIAVRAALGAGRDRLVGSTLMDSIVLAVAGGALGTALAFAGVSLFVKVAPSSVPRLDEAHVSWPVLLGAAGLSMLTALLVGALPALRSMRIDPQSALQANPNRLANTREGRRTRNILVAAEVACTMVLLIVTGLLTRSFSRLLTQDREFDASHITLAQVDLYNPQYGDTQSNSDAVRARFVDRALAGLGQIPGVQSVAMTSEMPMAGETWVDTIYRPEHPVAQGQEPTANMRWVSPNYVSTLRIPLIEGRDLQASDKDHPAVALISQQAAQTIWPGENPVGRQFKFAGNDKAATIVGVVADARINDLKKTVSMIYIPYWQNPWWRVYFLVRSPQPASALADSIRREIWKIDPEVPIPVLKSLDDQVGDSVATERFQTLLLSSFGAAALLLALLGVYGVLAYSVSLREPEFGIRVALGSDKASLMQLVVRQAAVPVVSGIVAGVVLAFVATRWIESLLYETKPVDPIATAVSIALLLGTGLLAAVLPARRAAAVDPMKTLKAE